MNSNFKIQNIFFCDAFQDEQFSKVSISGYNSGNVIYINELPYILITKLVIETYSTVADSGFSVTLSYESNSGIELIATLPVSEKIPTRELVFFIQDISLRIMDLGNLIIQCHDGAQEIAKKVIEIKIGQAPNYNIAAFNEQRGVIDSDFNVFQFFSMARKELVIIDNYVSPYFLKSVVVHLDKRINIKILTQYNKKIDRELQELEKEYGNIHIKYVGGVHDRVAIIDETEFYHFGYSFKDLGKKFSMFHKINEEPLIEKIRAQVLQSDN